MVCGEEGERGQMRSRDISFSVSTLPVGLTFMLGNPPTTRLQIGMA